MKFIHKWNTLPGIKWEEWSDPPYKIIMLRKGEYSAYFVDSQDVAHHVSTPPHKVPCRGCRATECDGTHAAWNSLEAAQDACIEHAANLPW